MAPISSAECTREFDQTGRTLLLDVALASIHCGLGANKPLSINKSDYPDALAVQRATFVTLTAMDSLRGCIGSLEPHMSLLEDVSHNAFAAAFRDPRFAPLQSGELEQLKIQISVLGQPEKMTFGSEQTLIEQLRPGIDGLILQEKNHRGTFLPSVWESLPDPAVFLAHLKVKAGLPADFWSESMQLWRYTTESFAAPAIDLVKAPLE